MDTEEKRRGGERRSNILGKAAKQSGPFSPVFASASSPLLQSYCCLASSF